MSRPLLTLLSLPFLIAPLPLAAAWKKHLVMELGANTTAVAADYDQDGDQDVITSYQHFP